ncbi:MAG: cellulase family glycosylhydrolase [Alphaproteobacteria bacterium]|nr:cellulase family glycosylhydrolase [Alphaproteobacteria bacterium]
MRKTFISLLFLGFLFLGTGSFASSEETPPSFDDTIPFGFGVNIHTHASFPSSLDPIGDVGFKVVRTNLYWHHVESSMGVYDWSQYDKLLQKMAEAHIRPLMVLSFSNPLYEPMLEMRSPLNKVFRKVAPPTHPESIAAFARYAAQAAKRYKSYNVIWEIWNEPDYMTFWVPVANGDEYARLAAATCQAIKGQNPRAIVIGPSASGFPENEGAKDWWKPFLKSTAMDCIDAISIHPYVRGVGKGPENNLARYKKFREFVNQYTPKNLPIISSEAGFTTTDSGVSDEQQGALLVRNYITNLAVGVPLSVWYDWRNDGTDPQEREHNFGLITREGTKKKALYAARTLTRSLDGYRLVSRVKLDQPYDNTNNFVYSFKNPQKPDILVAWTTEPHAHKIQIQLWHEGEPLINVYDAIGKTRPFQILDGKIVIEISSVPQYITMSNQQEVR